MDPTDQLPLASMTAIVLSDSAGAADWLSVQPQQWPALPGSAVLMVAVSQLSRQSAGGRLPDVPAGQPFWASARDAPNLLSAAMAVIAPPGTVLAPEPAW